MILEIILEVCVYILKVNLNTFYFLGLFWMSSNTGKKNRLPLKPTSNIKSFRILWGLNVVDANEIIWVGHSNQSLFKISSRFFLFSL